MVPLDARWAVALEARGDVLIGVGDSGIASMGQVTVGVRYGG